MAHPLPRKPKELTIEELHDQFKRVFDKHVIIKPDCWEWKGATTGQGYGALSFKKKYWAAHRASWHLHYGPIPPGKIICHHCDNPPCTNPEHLFLGTYADNMKDASYKGRLGLKRTI